MCPTPNSRPLSQVTGYMYLLYLDLIKAREQLDSAIALMEEMQPWFDPAPQKQD